MSYCGVVLLLLLLLSILQVFNWFLTNLWLFTLPTTITLILNCSRKTNTRYWHIRPTTQMKREELSKHNRVNIYFFFKLSHISFRMQISLHMLLNTRHKHTDEEVKSFSLKFSLLIQAYTILHASLQDTLRKKQRRCEHCTDDNVQHS